ncbi:MAG: hypothetical protein JW860_05095 [Sedimentisphaerales bacterium]|nr:hypothetical protein [Sedimentisphaerales bacterium]
MVQELFSHLTDALEGTPVIAMGAAFVWGKGLWAAFILGLVFGIALGPCTFAYMAPMLALTFKLASSNFGYGVLLLLVYGVSHCCVIVLAGTFTEIVQRYMNWNEKSRGTIIIKRICGLLVILGGLYLIYIA